MSFVVIDNIMCPFVVIDTHSCGCPLLLHCFTVSTINLLCNRNLVVWHSFLLSLNFFILFTSLYSVLKTFIHDPLVEWEKVNGRSSSEATNEKVLCSVTKNL